MIKNTTISIVTTIIAIKYPPPIILRPLLPLINTRIAIFTISSKCSMIAATAHQGHPATDMRIMSTNTLQPLGSQNSQ